MFILALFGRARNPVTGETELVGNISYNEWLDKHKEDCDADTIEYNNYKTILSDSKYFPKSIEEFKNIKYNKDKSLYKQLNREYKTIKQINKTSDNVSRDVNTYYQFRNDNIEMTDHSIFDYHKRMFDKNGNQNYNYNEILKIINNKSNYFDIRNGRQVNYYNRISVVKETYTNEIISIRKGRLSKHWKEI